MIYNVTEFQFPTVYVKNSGLNRALHGSMRLLIFTIILSLFGVDYISALDDNEMPYELIAPGGGTLEKSPTGEYVLHIRSPVKIIHGKLIMMADDGWIYQRKQKAVLEGNVSVYDEERTLLADRLVYLKSERKLLLDGHVLMNDYERQLNADHLIYWRDTKQLDARGNVVLDDLTEKVTLNGEHGTYDDRTEFAEFDETPELLIEQSPNDFVIINSTSMQYSSRQDKATAIGEVSLIHEETRAYCGNADLLRREGRLILTQDPVVLYRDSTLVSEIKGDTIQFHFEENRLNEVVVTGSALAIHWSNDDRPVTDTTAVWSDTTAVRSDTTAVESDVVNLASGNRIRMLVKGKYVDRVIISGNARSVYFPETGLPQNQDRNDVVGSYISLSMDKGKIAEVNVEGNCIGTYAFPQKNSDKESEEEPEIKAEK